MKTNLLQLKKQLTFIILLFISVGITGQTLVNYPLDNNLNPNAGPDASITPVSLRYYEPPNTTPSATTNHAFGYLNYKNSGDYLQFNFNLPANDNVTLQVNAGTAVFLSAISGNIQIYTQIGTAPETLQQQNLNASSSLFSWFDSDNFSFSLPISNPQASAVPVKIRIVGNITSTSGLNIDYFGIGNISLVREITSISVRGTKTPAPSFITHNAGASVTYDTDFGSLLTNDESLDKTYQITNTGSRTLKINSIQLDPNNVDFSIFGAVPTTINTGQSATFTVRFAPTNQGLKTAEVVIAGNITPDNPFRFEVKGSGKSCNLTPVPIAQYGFEGEAPSNMDVSTVSGTIKVIGGTAATPTPNIGTLYLTGNLYSSSSPSKSWYVRGNDTGEVTLEFGPVDVTNQQEVSINFDLAAFGLTNDDTSGVNSSDYIILSVYNPTTSVWSQEIRLNGSNNLTRRKYLYGASSLVTGAYDGNGTVETAKRFTNNATNYGSFKLDIPPSITQLRYRITAFTSRLSSGSNRNRNLWLIDNVHVDAGNAKVKTWTGTGWIGENTNRPGPREKAVFAVPYDFSGTEALDLSVCECEINSGATLTIPASTTLTVQNKINNKGTAGNMVIQTNGNLIQIENGAANNGSVTVERKVLGIQSSFLTGGHMDYVYWSSPVDGQGLKAFSPGTPNNRFYQYNETNDYFNPVNLATNPNFEAAKGYAIRAEDGLGAIYDKKYVFSGEPHNGIKPITVQRSPDNLPIQHGYNMIGNPYPSNINFDLFYAANSSNIFKTAWFWINDDFTVTQSGNGYVGNGYAVYNGTGGNDGTIDDNPKNIVTTNQYIKIGQGFIVQKKGAPAANPPTTATLNFNNSMRVNNPGTFYSKDGQQKDRFWLKLVSPSNIANTMLVGYIPGATDGFEQDFDAESFGMSSDMFYSILDDKKLLIQGKADFRTEDKIVLGANFFSSGSYTISLMTGEGIFANGQPIYLKDNLLHTYTDLSSTSYTFDTNAGINEGRFEIVYENNIVLATGEAAKDNLLVYRNGSSYVIETSKAMKSVEVYDASGRLMKGLNSTTKKMTVETDSWLPGIYIFKINYEDGSIKTKKVIK